MLIVIVVDRVFVFYLLLGPLWLLEFDRVEPRTHVLTRQPLLLLRALAHDLGMQLTGFFIITIDLAAPITKLQ